MMGEMLPQETMERLRAFLEAHKTGQFILHIKEGIIQKEQETVWRTLDKEDK